jgi:hypothetical protein
LLDLKGVCVALEQFEKKEVVLQDDASVGYGTIFHLSKKTKEEEIDV